MRERSPDRSRPDRTWTVVLVFGVLLVGVVVANRVTRAQEGGAAPQGEFFRQAPADPGAIQYSDLSATSPLELTEQERRTGIIEHSRYVAASKETRESVDRLQDWVESSNGHSVGQAWSGYTSAMVQEAQVRRAEYEAGLAGMGDVGVVP